MADPPIGAVSSPVANAVRTLCGPLGVTSFVGGWIIAGLRTPGYSPTHRAISQLARIGAPQRPLMTVGFIGFAVLLPLFAPELARVLRAPELRWTVTVTGLATLGVALFPLARKGSGGVEDALHASFAVVGYISLALTPVLAARHIARRWLARTSYLVGIVSAAALSLTPFAAYAGLWQRIGLTSVDGWLLIASAGIVVGGGGRRARGQPVAT